MNNDQTTAVVIPAYNEAATIHDVATRARAHVAKVIVVDDGSTDGTVECLQGMDIEVIVNSDNRGKAFSLHVGMERALALGCDKVITLDGDGQHAPEDIPRLLAAAAQHPRALIIAARLLKREQAPRSRYFANRFADFWISWAAGKRVVDSQSGFRLYPGPALRSVRLATDKQHGFVFESEVLIETARDGYEFVAVPIAACYPETRRASHFRPVLDIALIVRMVAWKLISRGFFVNGLVAMLIKPALIWQESADGLGE